MRASHTREKIVAEATRQLTQHGYAAFTVAGVRDALGLSSGSMFHAFASKPALAAAVYVEGMADYQRMATAAIRRASGKVVAARHDPSHDHRSPALRGGSGPERGLCAWIAAHLGWIEDHRDVARYLFSTQPDEVMAEAAEELSAHNAAFYAALDRLFEAATQAGLMAHLPRALAQVICIGPAQEYGRQWTRGNADTPPRKLTRTLQRAALAGLSATRTRKEPA